MADKKQITISPDICNYIEGLDYEIKAIQNLIAFLLRDETVSRKNIEYYEEKLAERTAEFELAKVEMTKQYNVVGKWTLDYATRVVTFE